MTKTLQTYQTEIASEINFLKKEIDFLLKLLRNGYSTLLDREKIKLLDNYWKEFEINTTHLDKLLNKITSDKSTNSNNSQGANIVSEFRQINQTIKTLKESFYEYMSGCCICSYKK